MVAVLLCGASNIICCIFVIISLTPLITFNQHKYEVFFQKLNPLKQMSFFVLFYISLISLQGYASVNEKNDKRK